MYVDDVKQFDSGIVTGSSATQAFALNITGAKKLRLVVNDAGNGNTFDHGDWADAFLG
ncbi:NPCBM/NEW2 domain protein [compost metagenome]